MNIYYRLEIRRSILFVGKKQTLFFKVARVVSASAFGPGGLVFKPGVVGHISPCDVVGQGIFP